MKYRFFAAALLLFVLSFSLAWAEPAPKPQKSKATPALLLPVAGAVDGWRAMLTIQFSPDRKACTDAYGTQAEAICGQNLGLRGKKVDDITISPAIEGVWRWDSDRKLSFFPDKEWRADTAYTVTFPPKLLGTRGSSLASKVTFRTEALRADVGTVNFLFDPESLNAKVLQGAVSFNYPVAADKAEALLGFRLDKAAYKGADAARQQETGAAFLRETLTKPEFIWNEAKTALTISSVVRRLDKQDWALVLTAEKGISSPFSSAPLAKTATGRVVLPSRLGFLKAERTELRWVPGETLNEGQEIWLSFNAPLQADAVNKKLTVRLLPEKRDPKAEIATKWNEIPVEALRPEEIEAAPVLPLSPVLAPAALERTHRFRIDVPQGRYVLLNLEGGLNNGEYTFERAENLVLKVDSPSYALDFMQQGTMLSFAGEKKISLHSKNLDKIVWEINRVLPQNLHLLFSENWQSSLREPIPQTAYTSLTELSSGTFILNPDPKSRLATSAQAGKAQFSLLDLAPFVGGQKYGVLLLTLKGYSGDELVMSRDRFVVVSDLGLIVKENTDATRTIFVASLAKGTPLEKVEISVLGANGQAIVSAVSNAQGEVQLPSLQGFSREKQPAVLVARLGEDLALFPLNDTRLLEINNRQPGNSLSGDDGMDAYVFSQRDLYRAGETLHFGVLVRQPQWKANPPIPVKAFLYDPTGRRVWEKNFTLTPTGLSELHWDAPENALSGEYTLDIALSKNMPQGGENTTVLGSTQVRVEEFSPQTMRMDIALEPHSTGWVAPDAVQAIVTLKNLYGKAAADNRVQGIFRFLPPVLSFAGFEEYRFELPHSATGKRYETPGYEAHFEDAHTDAQGVARFAAPKITGTHSLVFEASGFESGGGRAVQGSERMLVSSLSSILGFKTRATLDYIRKGDAASLDIIALNPQCVPITLGGLEVVTYARNPVNTLVRTPQGDYRYDTVLREKEMSRTPVTVASTGLSLPLPTSAPGEYLLTLENAQGQRVLSVPFFVAGLMPRSFDSSAEPTLRIRLDKKEYKAGDTIELALTVPYDGYGLISIERDSVAAFAWFHAKAGDSTQSLRIPEDFDGKGYVHVSYARGAGSPDIFLSPYVSAVQPFTTSVQARDMNLAIQAPEKVVPGELNFTVTSGEKGTALVFLVDEGILRLSDYTTPSPLDYFLLNRALDVRTSQLFSLMMPEYAAIRQAYAAAFGGGGEMKVRMAAAMDARNNPFKRKAEPPVQHWWGLVKLDGTPRSFSFKVPDYFSGQLRLMAVGSSGAKAGSASAETLVRGDIVISPQLPLAVAIGDSFDGMAGITNTTAETMQVSLSVESGDRLRLRTPVPASLTLEPNIEVRIPLLFETAGNAGQEAGENTVKISVKNGENTFSRAVSLSVRPASPLIRAVQTGWLPKAGSVALARTLYVQEAKVSAAVSAVPLPATQGLAAYLSTYPYGCTEQLISRAFPWLVLLPYPELLPMQAGSSPEAVRSRGQEMVQSALNAVQSRMNPYTADGCSVAPWPDAPGDAFLSAYAFDFLLTARQAGYAVSQQTFEQLATDLEKISLQNASTLAEARTQGYALWLLTRYGQVTATQIWSLKANLDENMPGWQSDLTGAFLGASLRMMQLDKQGQDLIRAAMPSLTEVWTQEGWLDGLAVQSLYLTLISSPGMAPDMVQKLLQEKGNAELLRQHIALMLERIEGQEFSSFSAAQATRALALYATALGAQTEAITIACQDAAQTSLALDPTGTLIRTVENPLCTRFAFAPQNPKHANGFYWQIYSQGFDKKMPAALNQGMEVQRVYLKADGSPATTIRQGDELTVQIRARSYGQARENCAITDMLPGGFEMVLDKPGMRPMPLPEPRPAAFSCPALPVQHMQRQEDRMLIFTSLSTEEQQFTYTIRAVTAGDFALPPVYAEDMYAPRIRANSGSGRIVVEGAQ